MSISKKILVIDDEPSIRALIKKILSNEAYSIIEAENGVEGVDIVNVDPEIKLVITDLIMPEKEGIETILELKQIRPQIKIIAISGGGKGNSQDYLSLAENIGADVTLSKPFIKKDLLDAINILI